MNKLPILLAVSERSTLSVVNRERVSGSRNQALIQPRFFFFNNSENPSRCLKIKAQARSEASRIGYTVSEHRSLQHRD